MKKTLGIAGLIILTASLAVGAYFLRPYRYEMGTFTTSLNGRSLAQSENIQLILAQLDAKTLAPGEKFSFTQYMGFDLEEKGYWQEAELQEGRLEQEFGGGVCQVSGTLYAASLLSGLEVLERHSHSQPVSSLPSSLDATVKWGSLDLVIKNPYDFPVKIHSRVRANQVLISLYGSEDIKGNLSLSRDLSGGNISRLQKLNKNQSTLTSLSVDADLEE